MNQRKFHRRSGDTTCRNPTDLVPTSAGDPHRPIRIAYRVSPIAYRERGELAPRRCGVLLTEPWMRRGTQLKGKPEQRAAHLCVVADIQQRGHTRLEPERTRSEPQRYETRAAP